MKEYRKNNGSLVEANSIFSRIYASTSAMTSDISNIADNELVFVSGSGMFIKRQGTMSQLASCSSADKVGDIIVFYGSINPDPNTYVVCDGNTFDENEFPALYNLLGDNHSPNLINFGLKGVGQNNNISNHDAIGLGCKFDNCIPNHKHHITDPKHCHSACNSLHCHSYSSCFCKKYTIYSQSYYNTCWLNDRALNTSSVCASGNFQNAVSNLCICEMRPNIYAGTETKARTKTVMFLIRGKE